MVVGSLKERDPVLESKKNLKKLEFHIFHLRRIHHGVQAVGTARQLDRTLDVHVHGVPGDMALPVYFDDGRLDTEGLFDFVVGNVCAPSHVRAAAKHKLHVARKKEKEKHAKYEEHPNVIPCALESFGGMGEEFHYLLSFIADAQATRRSTAYSVVMARLRANVIGTLWKYNIRMFMSCVAL